MSAPDLCINPDAVVEVRPIGDHQVYVVVDDFLQNPDAVIAYAENHAAEFEMPPRSYPGLVMDIARTDALDLARYIKSHMSRYFPFMRGGIELVSMLSMTTLQPTELSNLQRLCHCDPRGEAGRSNYAGLLYLFRDEALGGTGFYRWKQPQLIEQAMELEMDDPAKALAFLKDRFPTYSGPPRYTTDSNEIVELVELVPARFNRWVFYSGNLPHSAYIKFPEKLSTSFASGRLTLNCFASTIPK